MMSENKIEGQEVHSIDSVGIKFRDTEIVRDVFNMLEEGETVVSIANELELPKKDIEDIYSDWKNEKMEKLEVGDAVCFILTIAGYQSMLVNGRIHCKYVNSVVVDCQGNDYVENALKGRVVVSVKDILKM